MPLVQAHELLLPLPLQPRPHLLHIGTSGELTEDCIGPPQSAVRWFGQDRELEPGEALQMAADVKPGKKNHLVKPKSGQSQKEASRGSRD